MSKNDGEKREFQTPGTFKLLDWDSTLSVLWFPLNFDENRTEVQWNPIIMSRIVNGGQRMSG